MKIELPDNAREAFQFLSIGAGTVLVDPFVDPADRIHNAFYRCRSTCERYCTLSKWICVARSTHLGGGWYGDDTRLAVGAVFIFLIGLMGSVCFALITALLKRNRINGAVMGARIGMLISGCWVIVCTARVTSYFCIRWCE